MVNWEKEVKKLLIDKELTIKELGEKLGMSTNATSNRIRGKGAHMMEEVLDVLGYELKIIKKEEE